MKKIVIIGAGGFGREILELINQINIKGKTWEVIGFIDEITSNKVVQRIPVLGGIDYLNDYKSGDLYAVTAIGNTKAKEKIVERITNANIKYPTLIHPSVNLPGDIELYEIGEGSVVCANSLISVNSKIGKHVHINVYGAVGHDAIVGDYCSVMSGAIISGNVRVGRRSYIGVGAKIIEKITIGEDATVGMGSVLVRDVNPNTGVFGNPAREIKIN